MSLDPTPDTTETEPRPLGHWPRPLAFVLSGGAAHGAVQVGMLQALRQAGIEPDLIVGTSVGALNGVRYAAEPDSAIDALTEVWRSLDQSVFGSRTRLGRLLAAIRRGLRQHGLSLCPPDRLRAVIDANLVVDNLEDLTIPTGVVVTDAVLGQPKVLTKGALGPVLQATAAIPGIFPPVQIDGCVYLDGGVTANVPIRQAEAMGAKSFVVLDATPATLPTVVPSSAIGLATLASTISLRNQRADDVSTLRGRLPVLHLPQATPPEQSPVDFSRADELIEAGFLSARSFLGQLPELTDTSRPLWASARQTDQAGQAAPSGQAAVDKLDHDVAGHR